MFRKSSFSTLSREFDNINAVFLDGPAGTQVPDEVIEAMSHYYRTSNSNTHGVFQTTLETDHLIHNTRNSVSEFLGASDWRTISFGQNMTTLTYSLARGIGRSLRPGDQILVTQLDHEANRGPWLALRENGIEVNEVRMSMDGRLDYDDLRDKISSKTKLLAMGMASNLTGAVNDISLARTLTHEVGAWLCLDAVHFAPHFAIDVNQLGCDFLLCSAYKFYGPHVGILYSRTGLLDRLSVDRLRTASQYAPYSIETGTLNHAALAGVKAAIDFMAGYGEGETLKQKISKVMANLASYEERLAKQLFDGISRMSGIRVLGPPFSSGQRAPTISFFSENHTAKEICSSLAREKIFAWAGHFYAIRACEILGLHDRGGVTRMGISGYTQKEDIDRTLGKLQSLLCESS